MKKLYLLSIISGLLFLIFSEQGFSQTEKYKILIPSGKTKNDLRILKYLPESDPRFAKAKYLFENTFISQSNELYRMVQQYLVNNGEKKEREPLYLLLSGHQGGFPMEGFYLDDKGIIYDKSKTLYIDMPDLEKDFKRLNSMTQIFPHETAHLYFGLMAPLLQKKYKAYSVDMHYFSMMTNYLTAFNEGFAESFENTSRLFETDKDVKEGIAKDTRDLEEKLPRRINSLERDFNHALRLGYYRAGLLAWYQHFEDYKRYQWSMNKDLSGMNKNLHSGNNEKNLLYRNTGLGIEENNPRNSSQVASNEGIISAFFTRFLQTDAKDRYMFPEFYFKFLSPDDTLNFIPQKSLTPVQNHYLKIFTVFRNQMNHDPGDTSMLQLFVTGYGRAFPQEKDIVMRVYKDVTSQNFDVRPVPEIWVKKEGQAHSYLILDQSGGNELPFYVMNLNTSDANDLAVFPSLSPEKIASIIQYRDKIKGFHSILDIEKVPGLQNEEIEAIVNAQKRINEKGEGGGLNISNVFIFNIGRILLTGLIYFIFFWILFYFFFMRNAYPARKIVIISVQKFLKLYLLILTGLACFIFSWWPIVPFLVVLAGVLIIDLLKTRHKNVKRTEVVITTLIFGLMVITSLI